jgi:hypothetical protein
VFLKWCVHACVCVSARMCASTKRFCRPVILGGNQ